MGGNFSGAPREKVPFWLMGTQHQQEQHKCIFPSRKILQNSSKGLSCPSLPGSSRQTRQHPGGRWEAREEGKEGVHKIGAILEFQQIRAVSGRRAGAGAGKQALR